MHATIPYIILLYLVLQSLTHVRQIFADSQLLHYLEEAHNPHITHLQASNPVSFNTSFFLPTGGHSVTDTGDLSPVRQYQDEAETSQSDSHSIRENNPQSSSSSENNDDDPKRLFEEVDRLSEDEGSSHK
jgi:hypothetical protein